MNNPSTTKPERELGHDLYHCALNLACPQAQSVIVPMGAPMSSLFKLNL